jgi:hypothetical protein
MLSDGVSIIRIAIRLARKRGTIVCMKKEEQMERFPEERSVRGKIVVKGDGSRHLVVRTFAHASKAGCRGY